MSRFECAHCGKPFATKRARHQHTASVHLRKKRKNEPRQEQEESFADRAIEAQIDEACGIYNFDQGWLLP